MDGALDKKGGIVTPRANVIRAIETLKEKFSLQGIQFGELRIQICKVLPGIKNALCIL